MRQGNFRLAGAWPVMLALVLAALGGALPSAARAAVVTRSARPLASSESTPLCSPECELIDAPVASPAAVEYEGAGPGGGLTPAELEDAYGLPAAGGSNVTVAVVDDYGDRKAEADLSVYRAQFGLPPCTEANGCFQQLDEDGNPSRPIGSGEWVGEISLDLDMVSAACPNCRIMLLEGIGRAGRVQAIETAVELGAEVITNSWNFGFEQGNPANAGVNCAQQLCVTAAEEAEYDPRFDFPGVPILFSGGDYGYAVRYPAASPNVISVGGTRLSQSPSSVRGWSEEVWSDSSYGDDRKGRGTGSGCSVNEPKPSWETDPTCAGRIDNDVAAVADPRSPVSVYDSADGGWRLVGGTSASTPFVAGVEGLSSEATRAMGAEAFWKADPGALWDITEGADGSCTPPAEHAYWCTAGTGFDGPTGWGSPAAPLSLESGPTATDAEVTAVTPTNASLRATVDNYGSAAGSSCDFQVTESGDPSFASPVATVACSPSPVSGEGPTAVSAVATGLQAGRTYIFRVRVTNAEGSATAPGSHPFATPYPPPVVANGLATVSPDQVALAASVDNRGAPAGSSCEFVVARPDDPDFESPLETVPCQPGSVSGEGPVNVAASLDDLGTNTSYLVRVEATNSGGTSTGSPMSITTLPPPPTAFAYGVSAVGQTVAALEGGVENHDAPAGSSCEFEVAVADDPQFTAPVATVPCNPSVVEGGGEDAVRAVVANLKPDMSYVFRVSATNAGGASQSGAGEPFTTLPQQPTVLTAAGDDVTATTATLHASVDNHAAPAGSSCEFEVARPDDPSFAAPLIVLPCNPGRVGGEGPAGVSAALAGLQPATTYLVRVRAANAGGAAVGGVQSLRTLAVPALAPAATWTPTSPSPPAASQSRPLRLISEKTQGTKLRLTVSVGAGGTLAAAGRYLVRTSANATVPSVTLTVPLNAAGRRRMARNGRLMVTIDLTFRPARGAVQALTLRSTFGSARRAQAEVRPAGR